MKILLTGRDGQVGSELARALAPLGEVAATTRAELDLSDADAIRRAMRQGKPQVVVNAAAYTAVDRAEGESGPAMQVNGVAPGVLAEEAKRLGALLVHFSTDYVFDGEKAAPYIEEDLPGPLNVYGATKLEGERRIAASGCRHLILRTSWVYGANGRNFLRAMLEAARSGRPVAVVDDQRGAPTASPAIAAAAVQCLGKGAEGLWHLSAAGETTWHGFAEAILRAPVRAISSAQYGARARRPRNSLLDNAKLHRIGVALPDWRVQLDGVLRSVHEAGALG